MRDAVWNHIYLWQVNILYYGRLRHQLDRRNSALKFGSTAITMVTVACWSYWPNFSALWMALITFTQVASLYAECTDLSGKIMRLNYWTEDARKTINKITDLWDKIDDLDDDEIRIHLQAIRDEWGALDSRFLLGIDSHNSEVLALAESEAKDLLNNLHIANHGPDAESQQEVSV